MKKKNIPATNLLWCDGKKCYQNIGYISKRGRKMWDEGTYNTGNKYYCEKCAKKMGISYIPA